MDLYDYQREHFDLAEKPCQKMALDYATGSGKTLLALVMCSRWRQTGVFTHVIVVTHERHIQNGFFEWSEQDIRIDEERSIVIDKVGPEKSASSSDLILFLNEDSPPLIMVTTHTAFQNAVHVFDHRSRAKCLVVVDEAHRAPDDGPSVNARTLRAWVGAEGSVFKLTATPWRSDPYPVIDDSYRVFSRSIYDQMAEGYAPALLESELLEIPGAAEEDTKTDALIPQDVERGAALLVRHWVDEGRPFALLRVRSHSDADTNTATLARFKEEFEKVGARVYVASKEEESDGFQKRLKAERAVLRDPLPDQYARLKEDGYDVFIGIHKLTLGTDSVVRSHMYLWGIPKHDGTMVQIIGRIMRGRSKISGYPTDWSDRSKVVLAISGSERGDVDREHSRYLLRVIGRIDSYRLGTELRSFRDGLVRKGSTVSEVLSTELSPSRVGEVRFVIRAALALLQDTRTAWDTENVNSLAYQRRWVNLWVQHFGGFLEARDLVPPTDEEVHRVLCQERLIQAVRSGEAVGNPDLIFMESVFDRIVEDLREHTLFGRLHRLRGDDLYWYKEQVAEAVRGELAEARRITVDRIAEDACSYWETHGQEWPKVHAPSLFGQYHAGLKAGRYEGGQHPLGLIRLLLTHPRTRTAGLGSVATPHWVDLVERIKQVDAEDGKKTSEASFRRDYFRLPEVAYTPGIFRAVSLSFALDLNPWEGHCMGAVLKKVAAAKLERFVAAHGLAPFRAALEALGMDQDRVVRCCAALVSVIEEGS